MPTIRTRVAAAAVLPAVATMLFVQACGGGGFAVAADPPDPIEGVWEATVTQRDCTTSAALASFRGLQALHRGGTVTDTSAAPGTVRGPGLGLWTRSADTVTVKFRFFRFNADGSLAGSSVVTRTVTLATDGRTANGTSTVDVLDPSGTVVAKGCSTDVATRFG